MSDTQQILIAGLATIDLMFDVDQLPGRSEKYIARNAGIVGGGGAANAAVALSRLQAKPLLLARTGDDLFAKAIRDDLIQNGVDCSLIQKTKHGTSSYSSVLVDKKGERQIVNFRGKGLSDYVPSLDHLVVDAVLTDTRWHDATIAVLEYAKQRGIPGVLDAEAPVAEQAVRLASHVAFSAQGLRSYSGRDNLSDALLQVAESVEGFICVTDGEHGVLSLMNGAIEHVPAYTVNTVDTLGAGDVWHAAFVYSLAAGNSESEAILFANAAAALKCTRRGGGRQSPTLDDVHQFIEERGLA